MSAGELALSGAAGASRPATRLTPTAGWPKPVRKSVPFSGLLLFTVVLFSAPQNLMPALEPLMLAKVSVLLAVVPYLLNRAMTSRPLTVMTPTVRWAFVLGALGILSIPVGMWPGGSVDILIDLFGKSLLIFVLVANVVDTEQRFRLLVGTMIGCGAFAAAFAVGNYAAGNFDPSGQRVAGYEAGLVANPNDLALTLNILLGLALGLLPVIRNPLRRALLIATMGLLVAGIVVSFSRSGFVTLGVVAAMWIARGLRERGGRALPSIALVVFVVLVAVPAGYSDRLSTIVATEEDPTGSANERWDGMVAAVGQIAERPVLGYGLGNSIHDLVNRGRLPREVHNAYLKIGADLGVPAMIAYILFITSAFASARAVRRFFARRREGWELGRLAGGVEIAVAAFAVGALFSPVPYHFFFYFPAGLAVAIFAIGARVPPSLPGRSR
jgi:putative inorganic carbon (HCO3(-)) transporter